jgi:chemotaxis protein CheZ
VEHSIRDAAEYRAWVEAMHAALQAQDQQAFEAALRGFNTLQDSSLMTSVRKVTGDLQAALEQFRCDSRLMDLAERQVPDARHRLAHVLKLTDDAAHHTMDLVDQSCPLVDAIAHEAERLLPLLQQPAGADQLRAELGRFLAQSAANMKTVRARLGDVLLAQGYQDLSGQIIRSVMRLVDELEVALGDLVRLDISANAGGAGRAAPPSRSSSEAHGPVVPGIDHGPTVGGQQDVDAMLSGLGS